MSICHESCLVAFIVLDIVYQMYTNLIEPIRNILSHILKSRVVVPLSHLELSSFDPLGIPISLVEPKSVFIVHRYFKPYLNLGAI